MSQSIESTSCSTFAPFKQGVEAHSISAPKDRILIVDDSPTVRKVIKTDLEQRFECDEAGSYDEAIAKLKSQEFAVVLTDIIMPGRSGIELLRTINEEYKATQVIVVSGINRTQRALDAVRSGAFDYLIKPCEPYVLEVTVDRAIERRNLLLHASIYQSELQSQNLELIRRKAQLERLQAEMVQSQKMASLGQLAAGVAHEMNNPVGFVCANLEMLSETFESLMKLINSYDNSAGSTDMNITLIKQQIGYPRIAEDIGSMLSDCREGADRIRDIVQNLRTFSRLDEAEFKETDIHEGINSTLRLLSRHFAPDMITLVRDFGEIPRIKAFSGQLNQVWMNLLINAAQAIGNGKGEVTITTFSDEENIFVEIKDTGPGIAVEHINRIFDPFFTTKLVGEGTGLGLSIVFGIIERHGGHISVSSRLKEGTTFQVQLPIHFEPDFSSDEKSIACYSSRLN